MSGVTATADFTRESGRPTVTLTDAIRPSQPLCGGDTSPD